jgi:hypothetical protein
MLWPGAAVLFFAYAGLAALARPGVAAAHRRRVLVLAALFASAAAASTALPDGLLRRWIVPPVFLLTSYWTSGLLFVRPMPRVEAALLRIDRTLRIPALARRTPAVIAACLELAYAGVYPLIPIALALYLHFTPQANADRFWTVILVTDFICFGMLPWIQTRPPRCLEMQPPWRSGLRGFNVAMLGQTSIGVNTVPSGHAAEALAAALLVGGAPPPVVTAMWLAALAVSAGAVLGRYHFAVDAIGGWAVAVLVWVAFARG